MTAEINLEKYNSICKGVIVRPGIDIKTPKGTCKVIKVYSHIIIAKNKKNTEVFNIGDLVTHNQTVKPMVKNSIYCIEDDLVFSNVDEAAAFYRVGKSSIYNNLVLRSKHVKVGERFITFKRV